MFDELPEGREEELIIGDCVIGKSKAVTFQMMNTQEKDLKFRWSSGAPDRDEFSFYPTVGHLRAGTSKTIKVMVRGKETKKYERVDFVCETSAIDQGEGKSWTDFDDTMKTMRLVRPSEFKKIQRDRELAELRRKEEAEAAAAAATGKKGGKAPAKTTATLENDVVIDESEEPTVELIDVIPEPEHSVVEGSVHSQNLKTSCVID